MPVTGFQALKIQDIILLQHITFDILNDTMC